MRTTARVRRFLAVFGPGLVVMLADTDVGSVITAGQSGVQWGYRLLMLQLILVPILYITQELTVRLAIFTGRGHGELIRDTFGPVWAWVSALGLGIATTGALLSEFSGVAGVGELYGLPRYVSLPVAVVALMLVVLTGSYRRVERLAIAVGLFELAFFLVAWAAHPDLHEMLAGTVDIPYRNADYMYLAAANIGAVIMPWMVFYQQSAVADKRLRPEHLTAARWDTAIGALLTQLIMAAVLIACAATLGTRQSECDVDLGGRYGAGADTLPGHGDGQPCLRAGCAGGWHGGLHRRLPGLCLGPGRGDRIPPVAGTASPARHAGSTASTPCASWLARPWLGCGRISCR